MSYIALLIKKRVNGREHALKHHHHHSLRVLVYKIIQKIRLNNANPRCNCYVCMEQLQCILLHHYVLNSLLSTAPAWVKSFSLMWGMKNVFPGWCWTTSTSSIPTAHKIGSVYSYIAAGSENVLNLLNGSEAVFFYQSVIIYTVCENWPHSGHLLWKYKT